MEGIFQQTIYEGSGVMTENECAAIIILLASAVRALIMVIAFVCRQRSQQDELHPSFRPPCPPPRNKKKESEF